MSLCVLECAADLVETWPATPALGLIMTVAVFLTLISLLLGTTKVRLIPAVQAPAWSQPRAAQQARSSNQ